MRPVTAQCPQHARHTPPVTEIQAHHVLPQAWQALVPAPPSLPPGAVAGKGPAGNPLWDARTEPWCPTGHRAVHAWIVLLTRDVHARTVMGATETAAVTAAIASVPPKVVEAVSAVRTLTRWAQAGGTFAQLAQAHEWGEA